MKLMNIAPGQFDTRGKKITFFVVLAVILVGSVLAVYSILKTPEKQPYRDAQAQYKNVYNANVAFMARGNQLNADSDNEQQAAETTKIMKNILQALKKENELLGEYDVLKDGEGRELYAALSKKLTSYIAFNEAVLTSRQAVRPVIAECSAKMDNVTEDEVSVRAMRSCSDEVSAIKDVPNQDYRLFVEEIEAIYASFADNLQKRADLTDPKGTDKDQYDVYTNEQESILKKLNEASADFSTNLNKHKGEVDITKNAMALEEYLKKKSRVLF